MKWRILFFLLTVAAARTVQAQGIYGPHPYDEIFRKYSKRFFGVGFDWRIFKAQAMTESNLNPQARSRVGAQGVMQIMPSTFKEIQSKNPELEGVDDPRWNIAAGIYYDRRLWNSWSEHRTNQDRIRFMFGSYNAGRTTILKAKQTATQDGLDSQAWENVESVAPKVPRWRHEETLTYIRRIGSSYGALSKRTGFAGFLSETESSAKREEPQPGP